MQKNAAIARGFDRLAQFYQFLARFSYGDALEKAQTAFLDELPQCGKILVCGGGCGVLLPTLLKKRPELEIYWCDISPNMIERSRLRAEKSCGKDALQRVRFFCCDIFELPEEIRDFDFLITQFFLDCFQGKTLQQLLSFLQNRLNKDARWLISDFNCRSRRGRWHSRALYLFFRLACRLPASRLEDYWQQLEQKGWSEIQSQEFKRGLLRAALMKP